MSILDYFPGTPRQVQKEALLLVEKNWSTTDVIVINAPTATGKSKIAQTVARWSWAEKQLKATITTPTNLLVDQYIQDSPRLPYLKAKHLYTCKNGGDEKHAWSCKEANQKLHKGKGHCKGCPYIQHLRKYRAVPYAVVNNWLYMAHKYYRPVIIADEAHNLVDMLQELAGYKIWQHKEKWPESIQSSADLCEWLEKDNGRLTRYAELYEQLRMPNPQFIVERAIRDFNGEQLPVLLVHPLSGKDKGHLLWPSSVKKIVLLSATIASPDIKAMGLSGTGKRVRYIDCESPIPAASRLVYQMPIDNCSLKNQDVALPKMAAAIVSMMETYPDTKGLIHAPYSVARKLKKLLASDPRLIYHTKDDKAEKYQLFRDTDKPAVLVASGLYEGIDLPYDAGRWQLIVKVPWPSLADPAIKFKADDDPTWYAWQTLKDLLQACGRICRTPTDYGYTYILDSSFNKLYNNHSELFPKWFLSALINGKPTPGKGVQYENPDSNTNDSRVRNLLRSRGRKNDGQLQKHVRR